MKGGMKIISIIGEPLSGKKTVTDFLVKKYGYKQFTYSDLLTSILKILNLPLIRPNYANLAIALRERFGGSILSQVLLDKAKSKKLKKIILDGARHRAEVDYLRKMPGFILIYVTASTKVRYLRSIKRREKSNEGKMTFKEFKKEGRLATELEFKHMSKGAIKIVNNGTLRDLEKLLNQKMLNNLR